MTTRVQSRIGLFQRHRRRISTTHRDHRHVVRARDRHHHVLRVQPGVAIGHRHRVGDRQRLSRRQEVQIGRHRRVRPGDGRRATIGRPRRTKRQRTSSYQVRQVIAHRYRACTPHHRGRTFARGERVANIKINQREVTAN